MEETVALIKSCVISKKGGVLVTDLNGKYYHSLTNILYYIMCVHVCVCVCVCVCKI